MLEEFGLKQITLDLPFRLNHVNCFLMEGEHGWKIIDVGLHNKETIERWNKELKGKEVTDIIITHYHPDHFGYAGALQQKTGATLWMSKTDADAGVTAWEEEYLNKLTTNYALAGIPPQVANEMFKNTDSFISKVSPYPSVSQYLNEGEFIQIGKYEYEIIFTPGHSDGLVSFYNKEKNILLSTDHILPKITPNISYWFHGDPNPLKTYLESLDKIKKLDADYVIPSHGNAFRGANDRIEEIKSHHYERLDKTLEIINQRKTIYEACQQLFPKIKNVHESRFAIGETIAHLEYLRCQSECEHELKEGVYWYVAS
ncbi:MBL fold metallo-hydrolase [Oceanobacillus salinisoli]|uniref:MBL fold metallo-hydrolase n=1 Tax=Oceanobacillus salinisoli TaxID=2678611 RepID=UPI0012E18BC9|nr:MBL fold metallo-hydrolase [Oceanobacillus salinisoli]